MCVVPLKVPPNIDSPPVPFPRKTTKKCKAMSSMRQKILRNKNMWFDYIRMKL